MKKRVLITGASGFIGRYLVAEALKANYDVWAAVRASSSRSHLTDPRIHFVEIDYNAPEKISQLANELAPDGEPAWHLVVHNAGITKTNRPADFQRINADYTHNLLLGLGHAMVRPDRFILISSLSSYGPTASDGRTLRETDPQCPNTRYGASKLGAEQYVTDSSLPYTILLLTGVYGPGDGDYLMAIQSIDRGWDFVSGLKPQALSFVYVSDVARAALFVAERSDTEGGRYIVSDGAAYTDREFGRLVQEVLGRKRVLHLRVPLPIVRLGCLLGDLWGKVSGRISPLNRDKYRILSQRSWLCDGSQLFDLGFRPEIDLAEGLRRTIDEAKANGLIR